MLSSIFASMHSTLAAILPTIYQSAPNATPSGKPYVTIIKAWRHGETNANVKNLLSGGGPDDALGMTALTEHGKNQAEQLGKKVVDSGPLDVIYSSDLSRALGTAGAVLRAFEEKGTSVELRLSKQLREIFHGSLELTDAHIRGAAGNARFNEMLQADAQHKTPDTELKDKYRFWKIHPQVSNQNIVPEEVVNAEDYLNRHETRPETPYKFWQRIHNEFIRIAQENPGATVGVSMHGAGLATLLDGLNPSPKGLYLSPHYNAKEITAGDTLIMSTAAKIENCALRHFKYDSRNGQLEVYDPEKGCELAQKIEVLDQLKELPVTDNSTQRTFLVRHGESTANVYFEVDGKKVRYVSGQSTEVPLTEAGRQQITELAEKLAERFPKDAKLVLVSSTALRTQQTAQILYDKLSKTHANVTLAKEVYAGLNERHLGAWEGLLKDEKYTAAEAHWKNLSAADKFNEPEVEGGESNSQVASRAIPALSNIYDSYAGATVIAVTSFNTINAAAMELSNAQATLPTKVKTDLPKLKLGNGDLVLFETDRKAGFAHTFVRSHIRHDHID